MFVSCLKIALNNFYRHRLFAVINILGLAIGVAGCLVIALYVRYELGFDHQYRNAERIIRIDQVVAGVPNFRTPGLLADILVTEVEGVEQAARFVNVETTLSYENQAFNESAFAYADAQFLEMFDFHWIQGTPQQALDDPASVVLTQTLAAKLFGNTDPMGKVVEAGESSMRVTGVIADLPDNTHLRFSAVASMALFAQGLSGIGFELNSWNNWFVTTYALLAKNIPVAHIRAQLPQLTARHMPSRTSLQLLPLIDVYMHAQAPMELSPVGSLQRVLIFSAIAFCILTIAIINFVNLTTAKASRRAMEVGLRKSIGASRAQLIGQFLAESVALVVCAMVLGLMFVEVLLPIISTITGKTLTVDIWTDPSAIGYLVLCTLGLGIVAGFYPAFYLSAFRPVAVLKGEVTRGYRGNLLRSLLVIMQFSISIALIIAAAVIYLQIRFVRDIDMGFDYQDVVLLDVPSADIFDANTQWEPLRAQLNDYPGVIESTHSVASPLQLGSKTAAFIYRERDDLRVQSQDRFILEGVEPGYLVAYGLELLSGRWFSESLQSDRLATFEPGYQGSPQGSLVLNEEAARRLGWSPAEALGQVVGVGTIQRGTVVGVLSNTMTSTRQQYQPLIYFVPKEFDYRFGATIAVRTEGENAPQVLNHIDATWKAIFPNNPVQRYFLEDQIDALYQAETRQMQLSVLSALVTVSLACFGLYALAAFNAENRIKEIGVRKVMGGSVWSIVLLLTNDFSKLVLIANVIAWPVAYFAMSRWLENFAYRIDLTPLIFIGSGLIALCIAWVTVGGTAAKAASAKPVLALRYE